jgi:pimeloyl-ACP methyl ester carboxylesterase
MTEDGWTGPAYEDFVGHLEQRGHATYRLAYNTGRGIPDNGRQLHDLLSGLNDQLGDDSGIILIGHSMGGLVIRSACEWARHRESAWLDTLTRAVYLGSPHLGAPLEQIGHHANSMLGILPVTKPFKSLGRVRSQGIRDLRHGQVRRGDRSGAPESARLAEGVRHLLVGATMNRLGRHTPLGDGLVPLASALGRDEASDRGITGSHLERVHLEDCGHIELLSDRRVYECLRNRLGPPSNGETGPRELESSRC